MVVQVQFVFGTGGSVQLCNRVLVPVYRLLARGVDVVMRVLVRMGVRVGVGMHHAIGVPVLVGVYVGMYVRVRVVMLDLICHRVFLLRAGCGDERQ
jgi:hypothetical protein